MLKHGVMWLISCLLLVNAAAETVILIPNYDNDITVFDYPRRGMSLVKMLEKRNLSVKTVVFDSEADTAAAVEKVTQLINTSSSPVILWGNGWGGIVAVQSAAQNSEKVAKIVLVKPILLGLGETMPALPDGALSKVWRELHVDSGQWLIAAGQLKQITLIADEPRIGEAGAALRLMSRLPAGSQLVMLTPGNVYDNRTNLALLNEAFGNFLTVKSTAKLTEKLTDSTPITAVKEYRQTVPEISESKNDGKMTETVQYIENEEDNVKNTMAEKAESVKNPSNLKADLATELRYLAAASGVHDCAAAGAVTDPEIIMAKSQTATAGLPAHAVTELLKNQTPAEIVLTDAPCIYCTGAIIYCKVTRVRICNSVKANRGNLEILQKHGVLVVLDEK